MYLNRLPYSLSILMFTVAVFLLQLIPIVGVIFVMMKSMYWSVFTINSAVLVVILDCKIGRLPKLFYVIPIIWFGGYYYAATLSHQQATQLAERTLAFNQNKNIIYQKGKDDLVIHSKATYQVRAQQLVEDYDTSAVFTARGDRCGRYDAIRLIPSSCPPYSEIFKKNAAGCLSQSIRVLDRSRKYAPILEGVCRIADQSDPTGNLIHVDSTTPIITETLLLETENQDVKIWRDEGESIGLKIGKVRSLAWFPMPIAFCFFGKCLLGFHKPNIDQLAWSEKPADYSATDFVAGVLSLQGASVSQRYGR